MQCVASVGDPQYIQDAVLAGADAIELRLDLFPQGCTPEQVPGLARCPLPLIITVRSRQEGGNFRGTPDDWWIRVLPWLEYAAFVDIEQQFSMLAPPILDIGSEVIASFHSGRMLTELELGAVSARLRAYGIPKLVVRPGNPDDVITLCSFTNHAKKPIITSIIGAKYRYTRAMLPLFGSAMAFAYAGAATAEGQFPIQEMKQILSILCD